MANKSISVGIIGTGSYVPESILTNKDLEKIVDTSDEWITTRTGIKERRKAPNEIATSDMATKAAILALQDAKISAKDLDMIIVATVTPDMAFPSTACLVQKNIGADNAFAFDIEAACSGFIYGLSIAEQFIKSNSLRNVLVIGGETLSRITDYSDRNTCVLFGDGAGAAIVSKTYDGYGILSTYLGSDGTKGGLLYMPAGGSKIPPSEKTVKESMHYIKMDGAGVFKFAVKIMAEAAEKALSKCGMDRDSIDFLIPHQANTRIIEAAAKRLKISNNKVFVNVDKYGNMSAASVAIALDEANREGRLKKDDIVVLVGFGGGLTWGSIVMKWF